MRNLILLILTVISYVFSNDISVSKDSIKIYNNLLSSYIDGIIIKNNSKDTISLDSAYLIFDVFDTSGMSIYLTNNVKLEVLWIESNNGDFNWYLNEIGSNKYKLVKKFFGPNNKPIPILCPPHDSCFFNNLEIGAALVSEIPPKYPEYAKGYLELFFTNNEEVKINFYSDNLNNSIISKIGNKRELKANHSHGYFTLNGKRMKNINTKGNKLYPVKLIH